MGQARLSRGALVSPAGAPLLTGGEMEPLLKVVYAKPTKRKRKKKVAKKGADSGPILTVLQKDHGANVAEVRTGPPTPGKDENAPGHRHLALLEFDGVGDFVRGITVPDRSGHRHLVTNLRRVGPADGKSGFHGHLLPEELATSTDSGPMLVVRVDEDAS